MTIAAEDRQTAELARTLFFRHGGQLPVDIGRIALGYAFTFEYRRAPRSFRGALFAAKHLIVINAGLSLCRQRYVIAHELGHWLVHTGQLHVRAARIERTCQLFAAHLLMPPHCVTASARAGYGRADLLEELAAEYLVTPSAMRIQLQQLGLLPGGHTNTLERDIAADNGCDPFLIDDQDTADDAALCVPVWTVDIDEVYRREMTDTGKVSNTILIT